jgi:predicted nucleotidyltransferase component of viral defense system
MNDNEKREKLLLRVLHLISNKYKNQAILKGGMYLRLLNSPRYTQDIDFVFLKDQSRKNIATEIKDMLAQEDGITIEKTQLNSRGLFIDIKSENILAEIEISIIEKLNTPSETIATTALAKKLDMPNQMVTVMSRSESYSHKIAAALERDVLRDLYDISIFEPDTSFDLKTLTNRLSKLVINRKKPVSISFTDAAKRLKERAKELSQEDLERELHGLVPEKFLIGGLPMVTSSIYRLCQALESINTNS